MLSSEMAGDVAFINGDDYRRYHPHRRQLYQKLEMAVIAARPEISLISTLLRFYQMEEHGTIPRATAISAHDSIVAALPGNLDTLVSLPCISRLSIWNRDLQQLFDSNIDTVLPSEVLADYWESPWLPEEIQCARDDIDCLREKERRSQLGQGSAIDELVRRVEAVQSETPTIDMDMLQL